MEVRVEVLDRQYTKTRLCYMSSRLVFCLLTIHKNDRSKITKWDKVFYFSVNILQGVMSHSRSMKSLKRTVLSMENPFFKIGRQLNKMSEPQLPDNFWLAMRLVWLDAKAVRTAEENEEHRGILSRLGVKNFSELVLHHISLFLHLIKFHHQDSPCLSRILQPSMNGSFLEDFIDQIPSSSIPIENVKTQSSIQQRPENELEPDIIPSNALGIDTSYRQVSTLRADICKELSGKEDNCRCYEEISVQKVIWYPLNIEEFGEFFRYKLQKICKKDRSISNATKAGIYPILADIPAIKDRMNSNEKSIEKVLIYEVILDYCRITYPSNISVSESGISTSTSSGAISAKREILLLEQLLAVEDAFMPGVAPLNRVQRIFENLDAELVEYKIHRDFGLDAQVVKRIKKDFGWFIRHAYGPDMTKFQKNVFVYELVRRNPYAILGINDDAKIERIFRKERSDLVLSIDRFRNCRRIIVELDKRRKSAEQKRQDGYSDIVTETELQDVLNALGLGDSLDHELKSHLVNYFYFCFETIDGEQFMYRRYFHEMERFLGLYISRLNSKNSQELTIHSSYMQDLDSSQKLALLGAVNHHVSVIDGPAGRGKTRVLARIAQFFEENNIPYRGAAFTHRAVKQMRKALREVSNARARTSTIHSLIGILSWQYSAEKKRKTEKKAKTAKRSFGFDYLLIDEAGLVHYELLYELLMICERCRMSLKIIFVGDIRQLPPIYPGRVMSELLKANSIPRFELKVNHRQNTSGTLNAILEPIIRIPPSKTLSIKNAIRFPDKNSLDGNSPEYQHFAGHNDTRVLDLKDILSNFQSTSSFPRGKEYVIICSTNKDAFELNKLSQDFFQPRKLDTRGKSNEMKHSIIDTGALKSYKAESKRASRGRKLTSDEKNRNKVRASFHLRLGDRVINNSKISLDEEPSKKYKTILAPGTEGIVRSFDDEKVEVEFEHPDSEAIKIRMYFRVEKSSNVEELSNLYWMDILRLGYAITCNKAQGGEWDHVVFYLRWQPKDKENEIPVQMNRNLIYTAVSRAKTKLWLLGSFKVASSSTTKPAPEIKGFLYRRLGDEEKSRAANSVIEGTDSEVFESISESEFDPRHFFPNRWTYESMIDVLTTTNPVIFTRSELLTFAKMLGVTNYEQMPGWELLDEISKAKEYEYECRKQDEIHQWT